MFGSFFLALRQRVLFAAGADAVSVLAAFAG